MNDKKDENPKPKSERPDGVVYHSGKLHVVKPNNAKGLDTPSNPIDNGV